MFIGSLLSKRQNRLDATPSEVGPSASTCPSHGSFQNGIDEATRRRPGLGPLGGHGATELGNAVVAARRPADRRLDLAVEQSGRAQVAQHRIQRALLAAERSIGAA